MAAPSCIASAGARDSPAKPACLRCVAAGGKVLDHLAVPGSGQRGKVGWVRWEHTTLQASCPLPAATQHLLGGTCEAPGLSRQVAAAAHVSALPTSVDPHTNAPAVPLSIFAAPLPPLPPLSHPPINPPAHLQRGAWMYAVMASLPLSRCADASALCTSLD